MASRFLPAGRSEDKGRAFRNARACKLRPTGGLSVKLRRATSRRAESTPEHAVGHFDRGTEANGAPLSADKDVVDLAKASEKSDEPAHDVRCGSRATCVLRAHRSMRNALRQRSPGAREMKGQHGC